MFHNRGEVISDQFDHLNVIGFWVVVVLFWTTTGLVGVRYLLEDRRCTKTPLAANLIRKKLTPS